MISESPVVTIHIPPYLRPYAEGHEEITVSGDTVGEALEAAFREHPALRNQFLAADGSVKSGLAIYLGPSNVLALKGLATPVALEALISIMPSDDALPGLLPYQWQLGQAGQGGPLDGIKHVFDQQAEFGVTGNLKFAVEEQRVGVFLAGEQLEVGREIRREGEVGFSAGAKYRAEHAVSIGE